MTNSFELYIGGGDGIIKAYETEKQAMRGYNAAVKRPANDGIHVMVVDWSDADRSNVVAERQGLYQRTDGSFFNPN